MSQLGFDRKLTILSIMILCLFFTTVLSHHLMAKDHATPKTKQNQKIKSQKVQLGKATGPIQARVLLISEDDQSITLEGQVLTSLKEFSILWQVPAGASVIEGQSQQLINNSTNSSPFKSVVRIQKPEVKPEVTQVYFKVNSPSGRENERSVGVYNMYPEEGSKEKIELIRQHFQERGDKPMK